MLEEQSQKQELLSAVSKGQGYRDVQQWGFLNSIYWYSEQLKRNDCSSTLIQSSRLEQEEKNAKVLTHLRKYAAGLDPGAEGEFLEIQIAPVDKLIPCWDKSNIVTSSIMMELCANYLSAHTHTHIFQLLICGIYRFFRKKIRYKVAWTLL